MDKGEKIKNLASLLGDFLADESRGIRFNGRVSLVIPKLGAETPQDKFRENLKVGISLKGNFSIRNVGFIRDVGGGYFINSGSVNLNVFFNYKELAIQTENLGEFLESSDPFLWAPIKGYGDKAEIRFYSE